MSFKSPCAGRLETVTKQSSMALGLWNSLQPLDTLTHRERFALKGLSREGMDFNSSCGMNAACWLVLSAVSVVFIIPSDARSPSLVWPTLGKTKTTSQSTISLRRNGSIPIMRKNLARSQSQKSNLAKRQSQKVNLANSQSQSAENIKGISSTLNINSTTPQYNGCSSDNLAHLLLNWMREYSTSPRTMELLSDLAQITDTSSSQPEFANLILEQPDICSTQPDSMSRSIRERSLCPWDWTVNRDSNREPAVISEARCLCRLARGNGRAHCQPIRREFPVIRILVDVDDGSSANENTVGDSSSSANENTVGEDSSSANENRRMRVVYRKDFEPITVGCHAVVPRTKRPPPDDSLLHLRRD